MPIHTVYLGAQSFDAGTPRDLVDAAAAFFATAFPDAERLADLLDLDIELATDVHRRVEARCASGSIGALIDDLRIDFEDGYGHPTDAEEDADAVRCATAALDARDAGELPAGFGLRVRSMADATARRSLATLERFVGTVAERLGDWPEGFVVTLAKIDHPDEVTRLADALDQCEGRFRLPYGAIRAELMAETPRSIVDAAGRVAAPAWIAAGRGRVIGIHFGVYDYTASLGLVGRLQTPRHPACDLARGMLQVALVGTGVELSDGSPRQTPTSDLGAEVLERSVRAVVADIRHTLDHGIQRGWDVAPSQLVIRWLVVTAFYLRHLQAIRPDNAGDDDGAATHGAGTDFLRRGLDCGILTVDDVGAELAADLVTDPTTDTEADLETVDAPT